MLCSSPLSRKDWLKIAFNVEQLPPRSWKLSSNTSNSEGHDVGAWQRKGLATGWLESEALKAKGNAAPVKVINYRNVFNNSCRFCILLVLEY